MTCSKHCLNCDSIFITKDKRQKYCSRRCAAIVNNSKSIKRIAISYTNCKICGIHVDLKPKPDGGFYKRNYCDPCLKALKITSLIGTFLECDLFVNQTKGSLYSRRKNWQSANSSIRSHARKVYFASNLPKQCNVCAYDKHIEICHKKQVKEFTENVTILEINSLDNLIALCPNHHWEFDNLKDSYDN